MFTKITTLSLLIAFGATPAFAAGTKDTPKAAKKKTPDYESQIARFKTATRSTKKPEELARALDTLAAAGHWRVARYLAKFVPHRSDTVAEAAIKGLGTLGKGLTLKYKSHCTRPLLPVLRLDMRNEFRAKLAVSALEQIGDVRVVSALIRLIESKNLDVAKSAAISLKTLKHRGAIDPLIKALVKLEWSPRGRGGDGSSGGTYGRGNLGSKLGQRIQMLKQPIIDALNSITGESRRTAGSFRRWWKKNKKSFRVKVTPAPAVKKK